MLALRRSPGVELMSPLRAPESIMNRGDLRRFWARVEPEPNSGCWLWTGTIQTGGYGSFTIDGRKFKAHRVSYENFLADIPAGLHIDHLCRTRSCVNPRHLEPVTSRENLLRGLSWAGLHAARTHCPKGHAYDAANTRRSRGRRGCRACLRVRDHTRYWRDGGAAARASKKIAYWRTRDADQS